MVSTTSGNASKNQRDSFLDIVRTIATLRVVVWHVFGWPVISYLVAAMPAMFFVFGSLLAASHERRSNLHVLVDRLRRTLLPLWVFTFVTWTFAVVTWGAWRDLSILTFIQWVFPLNDPPVLAWEGGWLSSPLWFMRTLLWLLLTAPLWLFVSRKFPKVALGVSIAAVFVFDATARVRSLQLTGVDDLWWKMGDLALYGSFAIAGACAHHWRTNLSRWDSRHWLMLALGSAVSAGAWLITHDVHRQVVNNSHPLHLFVGLAWLSVAYAARQPLLKLARQPFVVSLIRVVNARSMTIYLWHTTVIAFVVWALSRAGLAAKWGEPLLRITAVSFGISIVIVVFGWVEDRAAGRNARLWPVRINSGPWQARRVSLVGIASVLAITLAMNAPSAAPQAKSYPPIPSQQPPSPDFTRGTEAADTSPLSESEVRKRVAERLAQWHAETGDEGAFVSTMTLDGQLFEAAVGQRKGGVAPIRVDDEFDMASITKFLTASMIFKLVDEGRIDLDAPLPTLDAVPDFQYLERLTPRMLLTHTSGLVNYRDTDTYRIDRALVSSPADALRASGSMDLTNEPGSSAHYSSVNFLVLGFLIEQVTGRPYEDLFREEIVDGIGLSHTRSLPASIGEPSGATAGTMTTIQDLLLATRSILHDKKFTSESSYSQMLSIDTASALGAGIIGFCPCVETSDGTKSFASYGHYSGDTIVAYVPTTGVVVGMHSTWTIHNERWRSTESLINDVALLAGRAEPQAIV